MLFHNRLTHSLKVAQLASRMALRLTKLRPDAASNIDPDVAETAGLAHDIGHPPFGHIAEEELQGRIGSAAPDLDSFEGNAQSFRIVTKLAVRSLPGDPGDGLNLTRASLRAILKYPWRYGEHPHASLARKWGAYRSEDGPFAHATAGAPTAAPSVEATLMDWADDITYAIHDVEDFYRAQLIPLHLLRNGRERARFVEYAVKRLDGKLRRNGQPFDADMAADEFEAALPSLPRDPYQGSREDRGNLHVKASELITLHVKATALDTDGSLTIGPEAEHQVAMLKQLTWFYVIDNPALAALQRGQRQVVRRLFDDLLELVAEAKGDYVNRRRLPTALREILVSIGEDEDARRFVGGRPDVLEARAVVDYLASLTEDQALDLHERFTGISRGSMLESWMRL